MKIDVVSRCLVKQISQNVKSYTYVLFSRSKLNLSTPPLSRKFRNASLYYQLNFLVKSAIYIP